jgi:Oxysterol-binding protein
MNFFRSLTGGAAETKQEENTAPAAGDASADAPPSGLKVTSNGDEGDACAQASDSDRQSMWRLLKDKLGGDVSVGISLPVSFFEPTTTLQRMSEMLHFSELLDSAAEQQSPIDKLAMIAVFAATNYNSTQRFYKPFNPILGETFEFVDEAKGVHLVSEQVSHHPPVSAVHCEGQHWVFWQDGRPTTRFNGNSIDVFPNSKTHVYIPRSRDHFVFEEIPTTRINNLIIGRSWMEHYGEFVIRNRRTGDKATVTFDKSSWAPWRSDKHVLRGSVVDSQGTTCVKMTGKWSEAVELEWVTDFANATEASGTKKEMWRTPEVNAVGKYDFTEFTHRLNEMKTDEEATQGVSYEDLLPRTDARLRADRVALEKYGVGGAGRLKTLLEERQRADRKARAAKGEHWTPTWFRCIKDEDLAGGRAAKDAEKEPDVVHFGAATAEGEEVEENIWVYHGDYWEQREQRLQWLADSHAKEAGSHSDEPSSQGAAAGAGSDSDGVAADEDGAGAKRTEPLGVPHLVGLACDFHSYDEEE